MSNSVHPDQVQLVQIKAELEQPPDVFLDLRIEQTSLIRITRSRRIVIFIALMMLGHRLHMQL